MKTIYDIMIAFCISLAMTITLLFIGSLTAKADDTSFKYGLGIIEGSPTTQVKSFNLRNESRLVGAFYEAMDVGLWSDTGKAQGRKSSLVGSYQLGVKPQSQNLYFKGYWGAAVVSAKDSYLGGPFQFVTDIGFGFKDQYSFVGLSLRHISSAGIYKPNKGRDFLQFEIGVSW